MTREDLDGIRERLLSLRPDDPGRWGVMSAAEMVCHVRGAFLTAMGEIACEPVPVPMPRAVLKAVALWAPMPWRQNFQTLPALERGTPLMQTGDFDADRNEAIREMERFCRPEQTRVDHGFFGSMSMKDWMRWGYLHTDHHLRQFGR